MARMVRMHWLVTLLQMMRQRIVSDALAPHPSLFLKAPLLLLGEDALEMSFASARVFPPLARGLIPVEQAVGLGEPASIGRRSWIKLDAHGIAFTRPFGIAGIEQIVASAGHEPCQNLCC